jgi:hypothetical protein
MSERSRMIGLMARREAAQLADARRGFAAVVRQHQAAEHLTQRLESLLDARRVEGAAAMSVAQLREHRRLSDQLAAEAERNRQRAVQLEAEVKKVAAELAQKDHRKRVLDDAALSARQSEQREREDRADAARTVVRRR